MHHDTMKAKIRVTEMLTKFQILALAALFGFPTLAMGQKNATPERQPDAVMPTQHLQFLQRYCYDCHDSSTQEGSVDLESINFKVSADVETAQRWAKVLDAVNSGEMPPEDSAPIEDADKLEFLDALSNQMVLARKILSDSGGVIPLRRLNRREYQNTIEQLTGIRPDVSTLPDDQATAGFDTAGASLFFSSDQLEEYLALARRNLELSFFPVQRKKVKTTRIEPEEKYTKHYIKAVNRMEETLSRARKWQAQKNKKPPSEFGFLDEYQVEKNLSNYPKWLPQLKRYLAAPENKTGATLVLTIKDGGYTRIKFPLMQPHHAGRYKIRLRAAAFKDAPDRFQYIEFRSGFSKEIKHLGWRKVTGTLDDPEIITFSYDHLPGVTGFVSITQRTHQDRGDKNLWTLHQKQNGLGTPAGVWIDWAEIEGPFPLPRADAGHEILFKRPAGYGETKYVAAVLERFVKRAFRGVEPPRNYLAKLFERYRMGRKRGLDLEHALVDPLAIVLSSPSFLYMVESSAGVDSKKGAKTNAAGASEGVSKSKLTGAELAVRLSQFLWSEMPDAELMEIAESGKLSDPAVLKQQTNRLLADDKSNRFIDGFVHQWLEMERLEMFQFNGVQYPTFDNAIRNNARQEIYQSVRFALDKNWPLKTLLKSDFVVINDVMADYYGIEGVTGHEFRKVNLPADSLRGGLMSTAAVLAMGSDGVRTSPVERGAWVLRHLLNSPPPPAPANVPQLSRLDGEPLSGRTLQAAHQEQPQCAQCHRKIDPIGFAMENFDAAGLWRDSEIVVVSSERKLKDQDDIPSRSNSKSKAGKRRNARAGKANKGKGSKGKAGKGKTGKGESSKGKAKGKKGKNAPGKNAPGKAHRPKVIKKEFAIDTSGKLPGGVSFENFADLREVIGERSDDFARGLTESLIAYGLGRPFGFSDEDLADKILNKARPSQYAIRECIHALVQSDAFNTK